MATLDGKENGKTLPPCNPSIDNPKFKYSSIKEALQIIYDHEVNEEHHNVIPNNDYDIVFICKNKKELFNLRLARNALFYRM